MKLSTYLIGMNVRMILVIHECTVLIAACPIEGQIKKECASLPSCHLTCENPEPGPCPLICVNNGCECPEGTVINQNRTKCIPPSECQGTDIDYKS